MQKYDESGKLAASGVINDELLGFILDMDKDYLTAPPPKSTGRERYDSKYISKVMVHASNLAVSNEDILATVTFYTVRTIKIGVERFLPDLPERIIIGGGGSHNKTMMAMIKLQFPECDVIANEDMGAPAATGARHPVVMGKITL
jgi:anhydro-N-acetylmuramic acid kinase